MVSSRELELHTRVSANSVTPTVPTIPGHSRLSLIVLDCPGGVPRSCVTIISENKRWGTLIMVRDTSGATSQHLHLTWMLKEAARRDRRQKDPKSPKVRKCGFRRFKNLNFAISVISETLRTCDVAGSDRKVAGKRVYTHPRARRKSRTSHVRSVSEITKIAKFNFSDLRNPYFRIWNFFLWPPISPLLLP